MINELDNRTIIDEEWDEQEYRVPSKSRLKRIIQINEEEERECKNENCKIWI